MLCCAHRSGDTSLGAGQGLCAAGLGGAERARASNQLISSPGGRESTRVEESM